MASAERRGRYEELRKERPGLFVNPPGADIALLLDEADVARAEAAQQDRLAAQGLPRSWGRTGVVYEDPYLIVLRDAMRTGPTAAWAPTSGPPRPARPTALPSSRSLTGTSCCSGTSGTRPGPGTGRSPAGSVNPGQPGLAIAARTARRDRRRGPPADRSRHLSLEHRDHRRPRLAVPRRAHQHRRAAAQRGDLRHRAIPARRGGRGHRLRRDQRLVHDRRLHPRLAPRPPARPARPPPESDRCHFAN